MSKSVSKFDETCIYFRFGQFLVSTLPPFSASEKGVVLSGVDIEQLIPVPLPPTMMEESGMHTAVLYHCHIL